MEYERFQKIMIEEIPGTDFSGRNNPYEGGVRNLYNNVNRDDLSDDEVRRYALAFDEGIMAEMVERREEVRILESKQNRLENENKVLGKKFRRMLASNQGLTLKTL